MIQGGCPEQAVAGATWWTGTKKPAQGGLFQYLPAANRLVAIAYQRRIDFVLLHLEHFRVPAALLHQLSMTPALGNPAFQHDENLVTVDNRRQTVRNSQRRAALGQSFQRGHHTEFGFHVQTDVASSSNTKGAFFNTARAIATR